MKTYFSSIFVIPAVIASTKPYSNSCAPRQMHPYVEQPLICDLIAIKSLKDSWTTTLTPSTKFITNLTMHEESPLKICPIAKIAAIPYRKVEPYLEKKGTEVPWGRGEVQNASLSTTIYSKGFGTCIAVAIRGQSTDGNVILGLHHLAGNPIEAGSTIEKVINQVKKGKIHIFISGGTVARS